MLRVLHVVFGMDRGGIETFIMNIYRNIDRSKIQFDFLVHTQDEKAYDNEIRSMGGNIFYVSPRSEGVLKNKRELNKFFSVNNNYKIVHQHASSLSYIEPLKAAKRFGIKGRIIHSHSTRQGGHKFHKYMHAFNKKNIEGIATEYFACSKLASQWMYTESMILNNKIEIIKNGIKTENYIFNEKIRTEVRKSLGVENKTVIGHVGRFSFPKNHKFLIEIFIEILKMKKDCVLLLVGGGELESQIMGKIKGKDIEKKVIFTGVRSDISDLMRAMDIFVFPSLYEGLPISLVEAQTTGMKCFASDRITDEVIITDLVRTLSLEDSSLYWAKSILKEVSDYQRFDYSAKVESKGYDIKNIAEKLQLHYLKIR